MKIYIGADHNGFDLRGELIAWLDRAGYNVVDEGDRQRQPEDDFPHFAARTVSALLADDDPASRAILICGSGQGMCMAANRFNGIRASVCWDSVEARAARNDDDSNVLCLPARTVKAGQAEPIVRTFLATPFAAAPRFIRRLKQLDELA